MPERGGGHEDPHGIWPATLEVTSHLKGKHTHQPTRRRRTRTFSKVHVRMVRGGKTAIPLSMPTCPRASTWRGPPSDGSYQH